MTTPTGLTTANAVLGLFLATLALADSDEVFRQARSNGMYYMESANYAAAEAEFLKAARATSRSSRAWMYKHAGDAAFLREDYAAARRYYSLGIATRFERDIWLTRDNPGWAKAVAGERAIERAEIRVPRIAGGPNEVATVSRPRLDDYQPLPALGSKHTKQDRSLVDTISRQLKSAARSESRDTALAMPVDPQTRGVPGSGIARVITPSGTCPAVRSTRGSYIASASCLARGAAFPATPWTLMHESGLHQPDVCNVDDYWTPAGKNPATRDAAATEEWAVLSVQSDCHPFFIESIPFILVNRPAPPLGTGRLATVEYADLYEQRVPVLQFCGAAFGRECTETLKHHAAVWTQLGEDTDGLRVGSWRFAGFAPPGGKLVDLSTAPTLVSTLQQAWDLGQRRRTQVDAEEKAAAR